VWTTAQTGVPLLLDALVAADCEVEEIIERHSHGIVIGRVRDLIVSSSTAALAYWQGQYVGINRDEDIAKLAEVGVPGAGRSRD
jgi:flavin reductase (DIM6/NTAB) family NADH-FMN oxidoreductase RutF